jgi:hypothetical protein
LCFVGGKKLPHGHQTTECNGRNHIAYGRDDLADAILLQLLWRRTLEMDEVSTPFTKGFLHRIRPPCIDHSNLLRIHAFQMESIFEHRKWLLCVIGHQLRPLELLPVEWPVGISSCDEESVTLVDLCEMHRDVANTLR